MESSNKTMRLIWKLVNGLQSSDITLEICPKAYLVRRFKVPIMQDIPGCSSSLQKLGVF
jgi:hypothetical protein